MKTLKKIIWFCFLSFIVLLLTTCKKEPLEIVDIFKEADVKDLVSLPVDERAGTDTLLINKDMVEQTDYGYHIKGTVFCKSLSGVVPVVSGDFKITKDNSALQNSFEGYGVPIFPKTGILGFLECQFLTGGNFIYNKGIYFKSQADKADLPLLDNKFYFGFQLEKTKQNQITTLKIGNSKFTFNEIYIDAHDPLLYIKGEYEYLNAGTSYNIKDLSIGLSANGTFSYKPLTFSPRMEQITGGTRLNSFKSNFFMKGIVPIGKYPLKLNGEIFINTGVSSKGESDFFQNSYEGSEFDLGANATITFGHDLLDKLPVDMNVELAKASMVISVGKSDSYLRLAGEFKSTDLIRKLLGNEMMKYIPVSGSEGKLYLSMGTKKEDWILYIETSIAMNIPGFGNTSLSESIIKITPSEVFVYGKMGFPYNIGVVELTGMIKDDGTFLLKATQFSDIDFGNGIRYSSNLNFEVSNLGVKLSGNMSLPYGLSDVNVEGEISLDCISLKGTINSTINFNNGIKLPTANLALEASSCKGIFINGSLGIPYGIGYVSVAGQITKDELSVSGIFSSHADFGGGVSLPVVDMTIRASTSTGIFFSGMLDVPYGIAKVQVTGELSLTGLKFTGQFNSSVDFGNGFKLPAINMYISASTDISEGIAFSGNLTFPGKISTIGVTGKLNSSEIAFSGYYNGNLDLVFYKFSVDFLIAISSSNGAKISGDFTVPGGLGTFFVEGNLQPSGAFSLTGKKSQGIDFKIVSLETEFGLMVSDSQVDIWASGRGCINLLIGELCESVGVSINPNWSNGSLELCIEFPIVGSACINL